MPLLPEILEKHEFTFLSKGSEGIVYKSMDNSIVLKVVLIFPLLNKYAICSPGTFIHTKTMYAFINEINIQMEVYAKTFEEEHALTAKIYDASIDFENNISKIKIVKDSNYNYLEHLMAIVNDVKKQHLTMRVGVIAMEYIQGKTIHALVHDRKNKRKRDSNYDNDPDNYCIPVCAYIVIKLLIITGINHADFIIGNILLSQNIPYFANICNRPFVIDFGYAYQLNAIDYTYLCFKFRERKYIDILLWLFHSQRADGLFMDKWPEHYGYICGRYDYSANKVIDNVRSDFNDKLQQLFDMHPVLIPNSTAIASFIYTPMLLRRVKIIKSTKLMLKQQSHIDKQSLMQIFDDMFNVFDEIQSPNHDYSLIINAYQRLMYFLGGTEHLTHDFIRICGHAALMGAGLFLPSPTDHIDLIHNCLGCKLSDSTNVKCIKAHKVFIASTDDIEYFPIIVLDDNPKKRDIIELIIDDLN